MAEQNLEFTVVKHVTLPLLKLGDTEPSNQALVKITGAIFRADPVAGGRERKGADGQPQQPPELMHVEDLKDKSRPKQMIVNAVLSSELKKTYPNDGYVDKYFSITKMKPTGQKRYALFEILEIRPKATAEEGTSSKAKK